MVVKKKHSKVSKDDLERFRVLKEASDELKFSFSEIKSARSDNDFERHIDGFSDKITDVDIPVNVASFFSSSRLLGASMESTDMSISNPKLVGEYIFKAINLLKDDIIEQAIVLLDNDVNESLDGAIKEQEDLLKEMKSIKEGKSKKKSKTA